MTRRSEGGGGGNGKPPNAEGRCGAEGDGVGAWRVPLPNPVMHHKAPSSGNMTPWSEGGLEPPPPPTNHHHHPPEGEPWVK